MGLERLKSAISVVYIRSGNARHYVVVVMVANDCRGMAFVLNMFKTNAKVRKSDLERGENPVESRRS